MSETVTSAVKSKYGAVALSGLSTKHDGVKAVAEAFGYTADGLSAILRKPTWGSRVGNPTAMASLKPGELWSTWGAAVGWMFSGSTRSGRRGRPSGST
ncbi:MAG: hypothetical protein R3C02_01420 [Planctomycetaceae bacterium]